MTLTKEMEQEFQELLEIALTESRKAFEEGDYETARWFKDEAQEILEEYFPENPIQFKMVQ